MVRFSGSASSSKWTDSSCLGSQRRKDVATLPRRAPGGLESSPIAECTRPPRRTHWMVTHCHHDGRSTSRLHQLPHGDVLDLDAASVEHRHERPSRETVLFLEWRDRFGWRKYQVREQRAEKCPDMFGQAPRPLVSMRFSPVRRHSAVLHSVRRLATHVACSCDTRFIRHAAAMVIVKRAVWIVRICWYPGMIASTPDLVPMNRAHKPWISRAIFGRGWRGGRGKGET